jgi:uncharacterized repeat protein (TIGR01451 family)
MIHRVRTAIAGASVGLVAGAAVLLPAAPAAAAPSADVSVDASVNRDSAPVGAEVTYTIVVTNDGPDTADLVTLTDQLPPELSLQSATVDVGICAGDPTVVCTIGSLNNGDSATATIEARGMQAGPVNNSPSATSATADPTPSNNSSVARSTFFDRASVCTVSGTAGNDRLTGTSGDDVICGLGGNDRISGRGGNDTLKGNSGNDRLRGQGGKDRLRGGSGRDRLAGGGGRDRLAGGGGRDRCNRKGDRARSCP